MGFECKKSRVNKLNLLLEFWYNQILLHLATVRLPFIFSLNTMLAVSINCKKQMIRIPFTEFQKEMADKN